MTMSRVSGLSRSQRAIGRRRNVPVTYRILGADDEARVGDLTAQSLDPHLLEQIVVLADALLSEFDERVLVGLFLERPGRMPREIAKMY